MSNEHLPTKGHRPNRFRRALATVRSAKPSPASPRFAKRTGRWLTALAVLPLVGGALVASAGAAYASTGTTVTLAESPSSVASGQPVTFTVTMSPSGGSPVVTATQDPSGSWKTAGNCAPGTISSSTYTCTWTPPSNGTWYAEADYATSSDINTVFSNRVSFTVGSTPSGPQCSTTLPSGTVVGMADTPDGKGYWIASSDGQVSACGDAQAFGGVAAPPSPIAAIAAAPSGSGGYWLVSQSGQVYAFGSAVYHGGANSLHLNAPIVAMAADPATGGYWLLGGDGGVFSYDAPFFGSTGNIHLNKPAVGMEATPHGNGYRFVASDGGIFDYGSAAFYGSMGGKPLNKPVVGMAIDPATGGYWLDAADGGIFSFNAPFHGSTGNIHLNKPCVGMVSTPSGNGYRFVAADGGIFDFGSAGFYGSGA